MEFSVCKVCILPLCSECSAVLEILYRFRPVRNVLKDSVLYYSLLTLLLSIVSIMWAIQTENFEYYTIEQ